MVSGYYWIRAIADGPWVVLRYMDGDEGGWIGKRYDWEPAEVGPIIPEPMGSGVRSYNGDDATSTSLVTLLPNQAA